MHFKIEICCFRSKFCSGGKSGSKKRTFGRKNCFQMDHFYQSRFLASKSSPTAKLRPPAKSPCPEVFKNALKLPPSQN